MTSVTKLPEYFWQFGIILGGIQYNLLVTARFSNIYSSLWAIALDINDILARVYHAYKFSSGDKLAVKNKINQIKK